ncbi:SUN domain-containing protein 1 isoform X3 [Esox lucius]|nr:SUN domain-containing protein 1 isoform X3 [Esox lucius]
MTMDFSRLHTYTPPQCAPENTGYTYSLSSSYSTAALEFEKEHQIAPVFDSPRMSRRSLRLQTTGGLYGNDSLADISSQNHGYSSGVSGRRESRTVRSRKQQSATNSLSLSLIQTPRKTLSFSSTNTPTAASDASLLSSTLDQSSLRQRIATATTDSHWGSDQDASLRVTSSEEHRSMGLNGGSNSKGSHSHTMLANGYICKDCSIHSERKDALTTYSSSSMFSSSSQAASAFSSSSSAGASSSSLYCADRSRRNKTGVLVSFSNTCIHHSRRVLAPVMSLVTLLFQNVLWLGTRARSHTGKGVWASLSAWSRQAVTSGASSVSWLFKQTTLHRMMGYKTDSYEGKAHSSYCGSMNVKDVVTGDGHQHFFNGSLCDDCKGKQHLETHTLDHSNTQGSWVRRHVGALWTLMTHTGSRLFQPGYFVVRAGRALGTAVQSVAQRLLSVLWLLLAAPGKTVRGLFWYLGTGWYQLVCGMSLFNVFFLTRCLPRLLRLLLFLLLFLLPLGLWFWGPSSFLGYLPVVNLTEWRSRLGSPFALSSSSLTPGLVPTPASLLEKTTAAPPFTQPQPVLPPVANVDPESLERLERVERGLALLWERVQQGDQRQEQRHGDTLAQYTLLREQLDSQTDRRSLGLWISGLLEERITVLRGELEQQGQKDASRRAQTEEQRVQQQQSQETRLAELEVLLKLLATKTEEVHLKQQQQQPEEKKTGGASPAPAPVSVSVGVDQEAHDALLAEVQRLEAELGRIRGDLQGVMGCKGKCEQLDTIQETVSAQVRQELRAAFYGSDHQGQPEIPEGLLRWLSSRYVSGTDLQALLASLELSILRNVSVQLEKGWAEARAEAEVRDSVVTKTQAVTESVQHTAATAGLSEEQVQLIVQNALKLYSQDRTGQVDYALESGGGSILSTRCSETYETRTALMSLFSVPLWYFSQSPRVVIQPDVYPGNCWAFKGSQGYLVIRLSLKILPTSFCLEHIPKALSPTGNITSAPRNFTVYGLDDEHQEEGKMLGRYIYQEDGDAMQNFPVMEKNDRAFQIIEVRVLTNWGHPEYTCLYRFRVHGEPRVP